MEKWRALLRRHNNVSLKYDIVQSLCRPRLTQVPSGKRNMIGSKPSWGGRHAREYKKARHEKKEPNIKIA
jgi:hypothetical protein